jgi:tRNA A-37 threonylcarbamoyl transferase component Bud32
VTPVRSEVELPPVFAPVLQRLRDDAAMAFSPGVRLAPVSYQARPFSNVMRLSLTSKDGSPAGYCFAKIQTPKAIPDGGSHMRRRVLHEFEVTAKVERALAAHPGMDALHAIACYPELFTIVTREIEGVTLLRYLEARLTWLAGARGLEEAEAIAGQAGHWLRIFQTIDRSDDVVAMSDLRAYIDLRLRRLVSAGRSPITALVRERVLAHLEVLGAAVPAIERRSVMLHADMAPANMMVTGRGIAVLDFAMASRGTYLHDISRLALQIDLLRGKPQFRTESVRRVIEALLRSFAPDLRPQDSLFRLLTLRHRINHLATLTLNPARGPVRLYNWRLRRMHERAIARELETPVGTTAPTHLDATPEC